MSLQNLDKVKLKLILKTSESFPTQYAPSQAQIVNGHLNPSRSGHPLGQHLRGVRRTIKKTKFCSLDDMAEALELVLRTPDGTTALAQLRLAFARASTRRSTKPTTSKARSICTRRSGSNSPATTSRGRGSPTCAAAR
jgi:hypothetical protein